MALIFFKLCILMKGLEM